MKILTLEEIKQSLNIEHAVYLQEEGFKLYSAGKVQAPPVGYLNFGKDTGEVHLKYGWVKGDSIFAVKMAGAFYQNPSKHNLPSVQGIILVFDANTGQTKTILQDEGYLTNIRTAIAGLIAAKHLAPKKVKGIGIVGTGEQARLQAKLLKQYTDCRELFVFGRDHGKVRSYIKDMTKEGFHVLEAKSSSELCRQCNLIVTTTCADKALIKRSDVLPGTHITAVGADAPGKQELDPEIFHIADICVADSKRQCLDHGEAYHSHKAKLIQDHDLVELGEIILNPKKGRKSENEITIADLTGISVQDIQIAKAVL